MRIVTRPDFDGIVCAVLLLETFEINHPILWAEPNAMQHKKVEVKKGDIIANLPYHEKCSVWFDHHVSNRQDVDFKGSFAIAPSAARVVYDYLLKINNDEPPQPGAPLVKKLKKDFSLLVEAADKIDSADLTLDEVLNPEKYPYVILSMTIASGKWEDENYWNRVVELLRTVTIEQVFADSEVKERSGQVIEENRKYKTFLQENTTMEKEVSITDFREFDIAPTGNRFIVYSLFPAAGVNVKIRYDGEDRNTIIVSIGHSIFNDICVVNSGLLCSKFGGGGHLGAGSCNFPKKGSKDNLDFIINSLLANEIQG